MYSINLKRLKTEAHQMMGFCFWATSYHWSSYPTRRKRNEPLTVIRVAYFKSLTWFGFNFCKYHHDALEVIQKLPQSDRYFYQSVINRYTKFSVWCIDGQHFEGVVAALQQLEDIDLEFVISPTAQGLVVPEPFQRLNLTFYKRGINLATRI